MFDPHGIRRYKRRTTRKGQIIQARPVPDPFVINPLHVNAYKEFIIKNNLIDIPTTPEPSPPVFPIKWHKVNEPHTFQLQGQRTGTFATPGSDTVSIITITNVRSSPITVSFVGYYQLYGEIIINTDGQPGNEISSFMQIETDSDISLISIDNFYINIPVQWILNSLEE
nr:capsid protein [Mute swan associated circo-like virus]